MGYLRRLVEEIRASSETKREEERREEKDILDGKEKILVEEYGNVKIYRVPGEPLLYYTVPVPRPTRSERKIIDLLKEATMRLVSISTSQIRDPIARRNVYKQKVLEIIDSIPELGIPRA